MKIGMRILHRAPSPKRVCSQSVLVAPFATFSQRSPGGSNVEGWVSKVVPAGGVVVHRFGSAFELSCADSLWDAFLCACMWCGRKGRGEIGVHIGPRPILFFSFGGYTCGWVYIIIKVRGCKKFGKGWIGGVLGVCVGLCLTYVDSSVDDKVKT